MTQTSNHVVKDGRRFRLCCSERTAKGPRRRNLVTLGTHRDCRTVAGAYTFWLAFHDTAQAQCKAEVERNPRKYKKTRTWQRAAARCRRAQNRMTAIFPFK